MTKRPSVLPCLYRTIPDPVCIYFVIILLKVVYFLLLVLLAVHVDPLHLHTRLYLEHTSLQTESISQPTQMHIHHTTLPKQGTRDARVCDASITRRIIDNASEARSACARARPEARMSRLTDVSMPRVPKAPGQTRVRQGLVSRPAICPTVQSMSGLKKSQ